jgi:hypothetical protein
MKFLSKLKSTSILFFLLPQVVFAKEKNNLYFDYETMTLTSVGIFNPRTEGEKTGLNAELIARKNGMDNLQKYFQNTCSGFDKTTLDVKSDWENSFHSQGTEIYSDGVLAVTLKGQIKQVFKSPVKLKKVVRTNKNERIAFYLPKNIPITSIRCGTLELNLGDNKKIQIIPIDSVAEDAHVKTIYFTYNQKINSIELDPAFKESNDTLIQNSTLSDPKELSSEVLPVIVSVEGSDDE